MALNALLILSTTTLRRPNKIRDRLTATMKNSRRFNGVLYVHIWRSKQEQIYNSSSTSSSSSSASPNSNPSQGLSSSSGAPFWGTVSQLSKATTTIYSYASSICSNIDVRFIVKNANNLETRRLIDLVFVDTCLEGVEKELVEFVSSSVKNKKSNSSDSDKIPLLFLPDCSADESTSSSEATESESIIDEKKYPVVALGGTFDRMHNGHKILLTESVIRCQKELIVGITDESMIKNKLLHELVEPVKLRMERVEEFLQEISPPLNFRVVPISDPFGPTITDKDVDLIVVSQETIRGATKINEIREQKNFPPLAVHSIQLFSEPCKESDHEEDKISSSSKRLRILGERLRPSTKEPSLPYIVGLTGGIASGKSTVCSYLESLQIPTINCDQLGHEAYKPGTVCFNQIIATFGEDILNEDKKEINRRALGRKVFGKPEELKKLTDIVWPAIKRLTEARIAELVGQGKDLIVLDAAVLLEAQWNDICHEVWVTFVPKDEAIKRIEERDKLSKEDAENRLNSQLSNQERISRATFAFCSLWEKEFTRKQVDKALGQILPVIQNLRQVNK